MLFCSVCFVLFLYSTCKWNHMVFVYLHLAYFTELMFLQEPWGTTYYKNTSFCTVLAPTFLRLLFWFQFHPLSPRLNFSACLRVLPYLVFRPTKRSGEGPRPEYKNCLCREGVKKSFFYWSWLMLWKSQIQGNKLGLKSYYKKQLKRAEWRCPNINF